MTLFLLQQFAGINAIVYYSSAVFTQAGVANATVASAAVGLPLMGIGALLTWPLLRGCWNDF